jgi:hypothetical protein
MKQESKRSLQQLEGSNWGDPAPVDTLMVQRCKALRRKPLAELDDEDLRLLIGQQIGLDHLVPTALEKLNIDAVAGGDMYEGALAENLTRLGDDWWSSHLTEKAAFEGVARRTDWARDADEDVAAEISSWLERHSAKRSEQDVAANP